MGTKKAAGKAGIKKLAKKKATEIASGSPFLFLNNLRIALPRITVKTLLSHQRHFGEQISIAYR